MIRDATRSRSRHFSRLEGGAIWVGFAIGLQKLEPAKFIAHDPVALAGYAFQFFAIFHCNQAAGVVDQSRLLQQPGSQGHSGAGSTQHLTEEVMGKPELVRLHPVVAGEQPAGEPFFDIVLPIARRSLRRLGQKPLCVPLQMLPERAGSLKFFLEDFRFDGIARAADLHKRSARSGVAAQQQGEADHAVDSDDTHLNTVAVF